MMTMADEQSVTITILQQPSSWYFMKYLTKRSI